MEQLARDVWTHTVDAVGFPTTAVVALTASRAFVIDTLLRPQDMDPILGLLGEVADARRRVVVNTHHHWDHVYGNAAFTQADIVAQRACPRLIEAQMGSGSETVPLPPPEGVPLPTVTFGDRLTYADEGETVHLIHTPGHTEDSLIVYLAQARILFGGDTVEWPLPNLTQRNGLEEWVRTLRQLKQLPVDLVVPSHGPAMDKSIIDANECYIVGLHRAVTAAKSAGVGRNDLDVPLTDLLGEGAELDSVYTAAHRENTVWIWDEV